MSGLLIFLIPLLEFQFQEVIVAGVGFTIHEDKELSLFPGDQLDKEEFIGFCELECQHKCKKITDSNGCNYYSFNKTCHVFKKAKAFKTSNKYNVKGFSKSTIIYLIVSKSNISSFFHHNHLFQTVQSFQRVSR